MLIVGTGAVMLALALQFTKIETVAANQWWPGETDTPWCDTLPGHLGYGDFNGDGKTDIICNSDNGMHIIGFSNGDGSFKRGLWWPADPNSRQVLWPDETDTPWCDTAPGHLGYGDFNNDRQTDLICNNPAGTHIIAFSKGDGSFERGKWWPTPPPDALQENVKIVYWKVDIVNEPTTVQQAITEFVKSPEGQSILKAGAVLAGVDPSVVTAAAIVLPSIRKDGEEFSVEIPFPSGFSYCHGRALPVSAAPKDGDRAPELKISAWPHVGGAYVWSPVLPTGQGRSWTEANVAIMLVRDDLRASWVAQGKCADIGAEKKLMACIGTSCDNFSDF